MLEIAGSSSAWSGSRRSRAFPRDGRVASPPRPRRGSSGHGSSGHGSSGREIVQARDCPGHVRGSSGADASDKKARGRHRCASRLHAAIDAGLHLVERCTGRLVDCKKEEVFVITYCATGQRGLGRHVRRPERKPNPSVLTLLYPSRGRRQQSNAAKFSFIELRLSEQRGPREHADAAKTIRNGLSLSEVGLQVDGDQKQTLLVTLDAPEDYAGGGTRFFPAADASGVARPFVARTRADHVRLATVFSDDVARIIGNGTSSRRRGGDVDSP